MNVINAGLLGFAAEGLGVAIGIILLYLFNIQNKRMIGMLFGCTSGIMIAMICFDILPEALEMGNPLIMLLGVASGILMGLLLEDVTDMVIGKLPIRKGSSMGTGIVLLLGIALHNIPEGFAVGTIALTSPETVMRFAIVICLHSIPEAIAIAVPMKMAKMKLKWLMATPVLLGGIMGVGAMIGYIVSQIASGLITFALGGAAGIILYIVCDELLPESRKVWNGRMTSIATVIGIIIGMFLVGA